MYSSKDIFMITKKMLFFYSKLNFGDSSSCYRGKGNVSANMLGKNVIARTNNHRKNDFGKGSRTSWDLLSSSRYCLYSYAFNLFFTPTSSVSTHCLCQAKKKAFRAY